MTIQVLTRTLLISVTILSGNISVIIAPSLKFVICFDNIVVEGTVSQIFYIGPGSFFFIES